VRPDPRTQQRPRPLPCVCAPRAPAAREAARPLAHGPLPQELLLQVGCKHVPYPGLYQPTRTTNQPIASTDRPTQTNLSPGPRTCASAAPSTSTAAASSCTTATTPRASGTWCAAALIHSACLPNPTHGSSLCLEHLSCAAAPVSKINQATARRFKPQSHLGYPEEVMEPVNIAEPVPPLPRPAVSNLQLLLRDPPGRPCALSRPLSQPSRAFSELPLSPPKSYRCRRTTATAAWTTAARTASPWCPSPQRR
jgi:hypothetical protein